MKQNILIIGNGIDAHQVEVFDLEARLQKTELILNLLKIKLIPASSGTLKPDYGLANSLNDLI